MSIVDHLKNMVSSVNPFAQYRRHVMRKKLNNTTPTFLCPNCIGGILFHDLGLQFRSPTVNLMMYQPDFINFATNLDHYLSKELHFYQDPDYTCPCAKLDDITIHFTHYPTADVAEKKWNDRKSRINPDNLFIFATERDGLTKEDIQRLGTISARGILVFTTHNYPDIPYTLQIPCFDENGEVGNILKKSIINESRNYEKYFDFVGWFNEANGKPYDVSPYAKCNK